MTHTAAARASAKVKRAKQTRDADGSVYHRSETRSVNGRKKKVEQWYARVRYIDEYGVAREKKRRATSHAHAVELRRSLRDEVTRSERVSRPGADVTFADLVVYFKAHYLKPAQYIEDRKVSGMRSCGVAIYNLPPLEEAFDERPLRLLAYDDLRELKESLLSTQPQCSLADVHRKLALLRRMLNIARRKGWSERNPFGDGDPLLSASDERERMRVLTRQEASALLAACGPPRAGYLKPLVMAALDTGMRKGELFKLRWEEIDFKNRIITVRSINTKTLVERTAPLTARLKAELLRWREERKAERRVKETDPGLVFGVRLTVRQSFGSAYRTAKLTDLRFHDLRHTAITWMLEAGMSPAKVMKISGHTQMKTFLRYLNVSVETAQAAAEALDAYHAA